MQTDHQIGCSNGLCTKDIQTQCTCHTITATDNQCFSICAFIIRILFCREGWKEQFFIHFCICWRDRVRDIQGKQYTMIKHMMFLALHMEWFITVKCTCIYRSQSIPITGSTVTFTSGIDINADDLMPVCIQLSENGTCSRIQYTMISESIDSIDNDICSFCRLDIITEKGWIQLIICLPCFICFR